MKKRFSIFRFNPDYDQAPRYQGYALEVSPEESLLTCLNRIKWEQDGTLTFRRSCGHGVCGSCAVRADGVCGLACQRLVQDYQEQEVIVIEPLPGFTVLKDLVVDLTPFFQRVAFIRPFLENQDEPPPGAERRQTPAQHALIEPLARCILCASCAAVCPISHENPHYLGPAALVQAARRVFDSRDGETEARLSQLDYPDGVHACLNHFDCTKVCPKQVPVTKAINQLKRQLARLGPGA